MDSSLKVMTFCSHCGAKLVSRRSEPDHRERRVCQACEAVHFQNPKILVMALIHCQDRLLVCQRAEEPALNTGPESLDARFMTEDGLRQADIAWSDKLGDSRERLFRQIRARRFEIHLTDVAAWPDENMAARSYRIELPGDGMSE